jgi:hypothetical protein
VEGGEGGDVEVDVGGDSVQDGGEEDRRGCRGLEEREEEGDGGR